MRVFLEKIGAKMRREFGKYLFDLMAKDDRIWVITADLGFGLFDKIRDTYPDRFLNTGAAEQAASDICVGLALEGKIPFFYSITPFLLYRCFETLRTYIDHENIPVILIGSGRNDDYKHDGFSHYAGDDYRFMGQFENIKSYWPERLHQMRELLDEAVKGEKPMYINLER